MRIYAFTEHFPSPYKPYLDTQLSDLLEAGHELRIFAFGKFAASENPRTARLLRRTRYLPLTLRTLPRLVTPRALFAGPVRTLRTWDGLQPPKRSVLDVARAALLPRTAPDLCLIHNLVTAQYVGFLERLYPRARIALYFHGGEVPNAGAITPAETRLAFSRAHRVFTNTQYSRDLAIARGCLPEKVIVCPVGLRLEDYVPAEPRVYRREGVLRLLSVGRLSPEKGFEVALEAVRLSLTRGLAGRLRYRIVGRGPELGRLEETIRGHRLEAAVALVGERSSAALLEEYAAADALLLPSLRTPSWEESQACVAQEAMLMKLPVVATRTGGLPESLAPALHPFLVEPGDPEALAARIATLAGLDESELARLGEEGRRFARARYGVGELDARLLQEAMAPAIQEARRAS